MNDEELRQTLFELQEKFGSSTSFIARRCGVSREHLSRWLHDDNYVISSDLKNRLKQFTKEGKA